MRKSKCVYCVDGIVLNKETNEIIAGCFCAIDAWDETVRCKKKDGVSIINAGMKARLKKWRKDEN